MPGYVKWLIAAGVVTIAGLAWVAMPCACSDTRNKAYSYAMRTDLGNLMVAQDSAFAKDSAYSEAFDTLFFASTSVTIDVTEASDSGWQARARHPEFRGACVIWVGAVATPPIVDDQPVPKRRPVCSAQGGR